MEYKRESELIHEVERRLAEELLGYMQMDESVSLRWTDTTQHLVEAVHYLYISELMRSDDGILLTKKAIAEMVFSRLKVSLPCNLSTYLSRIRNIKGKKSVTLLDQNVMKMQKYARYEGIGRYVESEEFLSEE